MKTVYTGREVPHIFAQRNIPAARNSNDTLRFDGATLRSYAEPIAHFLPDGRCLVSVDKFSVTTSKHQAWTRYALNHMPTVWVTDLWRLVDIVTYRGEHETLEYIKRRMANIAALESRLEKQRSDWKKSETRQEIQVETESAAIAWQALGKRGDWRKTAGSEIVKRDRAEKRRRYQSTKDSLAAAIDVDMSRLSERVAEIEARGETYQGATFFALENLRDDLMRRDALGALRHPLTSAAWKDARKLMGKAWAAEYLALARRVETAAQSLQPRIDELRAAHIAAERLTNAEKLEKWLNGDNVAAPRLCEVVCRVKGDTVETSQGARVPLNDALRVVKLAKACRDKGEGMQRETFATGPYKGVTVDALGNVTIGCHRLTWQCISDCVARFMPEVLA